MNARPRSVAVATTLVLLMTSIVSCADSSSEPLCSWKTLRSMPHDDQAFTQGLVLHGSRMFESTGLYGKSTLREVDPETGKVLRSKSLKREFFGEGMTIFDNRIYQITWREQRAFVYDIENFELKTEFSYPGEGWGLTHDGSSLIMSDGTPEVRFMDPVTFKEQRRITVSGERGKVFNINELEYVDGSVYANIWQTPLIVKFNPQTGDVEHWIDASQILGPRAVRGVMNGIAWNEKQRSFFLTGKNWPVLFEVQISCKD